MTTIAIITGIILMAIMGIILAYELTPFNKMPVWLETVYNKVVNLLNRIFY